MVELPGRYSNSELLALLRSFTRPVATAPDARNMGIREVQTQHRLAPKEIKQLVEKYKTGTSMRVLAERWQIHRTTVSAHILLAGVPRRK